METETIIENAIDSQGWNDSTVIDILLAYIKNQDDNATFQDFVEGFYA